MIKAIIFDIGETVINRYWKTQRKNIYKRFGIYPIWGEKANKIKSLSSLGKKSLKDAFRESIKKQNSKISLKEFIEFYKKEYERTSPPRKSMISLIKKLRENYKIYAFSNTHDLHEEVNQKRKFWENFDDIFLSNEIHLVKPDKKAYLYVLKSIKLNPEECVFIDDNKENILAAKSLKIKAVQYTTYHSLLKSLKKLGVKLR